MDFRMRNRLRREKIPPALLRYRVGESLSIAEFIRIGRGCAKLVEDHLRRAGFGFSEGKSILDFGCGCARILRWLAYDYPGVNWHGVDVDADAISWVRCNLPYVHAELISPDPPLPFENNRFDSVYCFSVFTHLDEELQDDWLVELRRVLKPGGILLLTVHGDAAATTALDGRGMVELQTAGFLHRTSEKLRGLTPARYHTSWHTIPHITRKLEAIFGTTSYYQVPDGMQDIVVATKDRA